MAVNPIVIFALTFKARNTYNRVLRQSIWSKSTVWSYQKQGLMLELLVFEQPQTHNPMNTDHWSRAQL